MNNLINKFICGDCLDVMKDIPDKSIDLIVTDSPYKGHFEQAGGMASKRMYMSNIRSEITSGMNFEIYPYLELIKSKMKIFNGYFWCSLKMIYDLIGFAIKNKYNYNLITWYKPNAIPLINNTYLPDCEWCIFIRESGAFFNSDTYFSNYKKVFICNVNKSQYGHPTEKPLDLILPAIKISSNENDIVLDPFAGSGTTAVACHKLKRRFICIEKNIKYIEIAKKRYAEVIAQQNLFEKELLNGNK